VPICCYANHTGCRPPYSASHLGSLWARPLNPRGIRSRGRRPFVHARHLRATCAVSDRNLRVMRQRGVMSLSGGKDSAPLPFISCSVIRVSTYRAVTTITDDHERITRHGVRVELLRRQAASIGLLVVEVRIPPGCINEVYESRMAEPYDDPLLVSSDAIASCDIFSEDVRAYREERFRGSGKEPLFPIWRTPSVEVAATFMALGFRAVITCVDPAKASANICGARVRPRFPRVSSLRDRPVRRKRGVPYFRLRGPIFSALIPPRRGELVKRGGFLFMRPRETMGRCP
jgi:diphthamide synthase (EF-2-diphthine--ammonia ligase)